MAVDWTDDQTETLRQRWSEGATASQIATEISTTARPVSRNAVIGKAHRMDFDGRPRSKPGPKPTPKSRPSVERRLTKRPRRPTTAADSPSRDRPSAPAKAQEPAETTVSCCDIVSHSIEITDLKHDSCRWIEGSPSDALYCGAVSEPQSAYCAGHARMAYARRAS